MTAAIVAAAALIALLVVVALTRPSSKLGLGWWVIAAFVFVAYEYPTLPPLISLAGVSLLPQDAVALALLMHALPRSTDKPLPFTPKQRVLLGAALLVIGLSLLRGVAGYGATIAINEARGLLWLVVGIVWVTRQAERDPYFDDGFSKFMNLIGWSLTMLAAYHVQVRGFGSVDGFVELRGQQVTDRALVSGQALMLAAAGMYRLLSNRHKWLGVIFLGVAVVTLHRSVWVAIVVAIVFALVRVEAVARARVLITTFAVSALVALANAMGLLGALPKRILGGVASRGTIDDRTDTWERLVLEQNQMDFATILFGQPFGSGYERLNMLRELVEYTPHNWYVVLYLRIGLIGLSCVAVVMFSALLRHLYRRNATGASLLVLIAVYAVPYHLPWYVAPLLAVGLVHNLRDPGQKQGPVNAGDVGAGLASRPCGDTQSSHPAVKSSVKSRVVV